MIINFPVDWCESPEVVGLSAKQFMVAFRKKFSECVFERREELERRRPMRNHHKALRAYRERGASGHHSLSEWLSLVERHEFRCVYCGVRPKELTRDHVVPIARGGSNAIENIVPACRSCNSRKGAKVIA